MSRAERVALLAFFAGVLALVGWRELEPAVVGGLAGAAVGVAVAGRLRRLSGRMDARLGVAEQPRRGLRVRTVAVRASLHLLVLGTIALSTLFVPFVGDELTAASASAVTALAAVLTGARLRR